MRIRGVPLSYHTHHQCWPLLTLSVFSGRCLVCVQFPPFPPSSSPRATAERYSVPYLSALQPFLCEAARVLKQRFADFWKHECAFFMPRLAFMPCLVVLAIKPSCVLTDASFLLLLTGACTDVNKAFLTGEAKYMSTGRGAHTEWMNPSMTFVGCVGVLAIKGGDSSPPPVNMRRLSRKALPQVTGGTLAS